MSIFCWGSCSSSSPSFTREARLVSLAALPGSYSSTPTLRFHCTHFSAYFYRPNKIHKDERGKPPRYRSTETACLACRPSLARATIHIATCVELSNSSQLATLPPHLSSRPATLFSTPKISLDIFPYRYVFSTHAARLHHFRRFQR